MTWEAVYQAILTGQSASVTGTATVTSQAMRADSAQVQLVAGSIRRARLRQPNQDRFELAAVVVAEGTAVAEEEAVGETHVYTLPDPITIEPGVPVATALFPRVNTAVSQEFVVPGVLPWRGYIGAQPGESRPPVQTWYTMRRSRGSPFGDRPLPGGTMQLYQADAAGRLQLVGEAAIGHTAPGRDLRVQSGDVFDLSVERVQTEY
jgi:hypothetical protein